MSFLKMAQVGLVNQVNFHSHTSQYGAMSRAAEDVEELLKKPELQNELDNIKDAFEPE